MAATPAGGGIWTSHADVMVAVLTAFGRSDDGNSICMACAEFWWGECDRSSLLRPEENLKKTRKMGRKMVLGEKEGEEPGGKAQSRGGKGGSSSSLPM